MSLVLGAVLLAPGRLRELSEGGDGWAVAVAAVSFLLAIGLYLRTMYAYDTSLMPIRFWATAARQPATALAGAATPEQRRVGALSEHDARLDVPVYARDRRRDRRSAGPCVFGVRTDVGRGPRGRSCARRRWVVRASTRPCARQPGLTASAGARVWRCLRLQPARHASGPPRGGVDRERHVARAVDFVDHHVRCARGLRRPRGDIDDV